MAGGGHCDFRRTSPGTSRGLMSSWILFLHCPMGLWSVTALPYNRRHMVALILHHAPQMPRLHRAIDSICSSSQIHWKVTLQQTAIVIRLYQTSVQYSYPSPTLPIPIAGLFGLRSNYFCRQRHHHNGRRGGRLSYRGAPAIPC